MVPGLLYVEQAVTLGKKALLLQRNAAVHQGPLHAVRAPAQTLGESTIKVPYGSLMFMCEGMVCLVQKIADLVQFFWNSVNNYIRL